MAVYASNEELLKEFKKSKEEGKLTPRMAELLRLIAERYAMKPSFAQYTYREDMVSHAVVNLMDKWHMFNPEKSSNPFAYFTTSVYRSFLHFLAMESTYASVKDDMRQEYGLPVSFKRQLSEE